MDGIIDTAIGKKLECFKKLERNTNPIINMWVRENIKSLSEQLRREQISENYRNLC